MRSQQTFIVAALLLLGLLPLSLQAQENRGQLSLDAPYDITVGEYIAFLSSEVDKISTDFDAPVLFVFNRSRNLIEVEIYGARGSVDGATGSLEKYWDFIEREHIPYIQKRLGLKLNEKDYHVMYYDRRDRNGPKLIVSMDQGRMIEAKK